MNMRLAVVAAVLMVAALHLVAVGAVLRFALAGSAAAVLAVFLLAVKG